MTIHALIACNKGTNEGRCGYQGRTSLAVGWSAWEDDVTCPECVAASSAKQKAGVAANRLQAGRKLVPAANVPPTPAQTTTDARSAVLAQLNAVFG